MKKTFYSIAMLLVSIVLCGCGIHKNYSKEILEELSKKYDKDFEIVRLRYEFNGQGTYYRAICKEKNDDRTFVAYYSPNEEEPLSDEYGNLYLGDLYSDYILKSDDNILFALADVTFNEKSPTKSDIDKDLEYCLNLDNYEALPKVFIFINNSVADKETFERNFLKQNSSLNIYMQSIYFVYIDENDYQEVKDRYKDASEYLLDDKLQEDNITHRISYWLLESGNLEPKYYKIEKES